MQNTCICGSRNLKYINAQRDYHYTGVKWKMRNRPPHNIKHQTQSTENTWICEGAKATTSTYLRVKYLP
jgi:hypothetical protein